MSYRGLSCHDHRLLIGLIIILIMAITDFTALWLVVKIDWGTLPGPEAGIVSSMISSVVVGIMGIGGMVVSFYFTASPVVPQSNHATPQQPSGEAKP